MLKNVPPKVAIIDYGMGNVTNIRRACTTSGINAFVTADKQDIISADALILPGVGAFGDAMDALDKLDLTAFITDCVSKGIPLLGICLGMQLCMSESFEFGKHKGLNFISGKVIRFDNPKDSDGQILKIPQVGWNYIIYPNADRNSRKGTLLDSIDEGELMYFVHSYYTVPDDRNVCLSASNYGGINFCSALQYKNIMACQFHPEKSAVQGLKIYRNFRKFISNQ